MIVFLALEWNSWHLSKALSKLGAIVGFINILEPIFLKTKKTHCRWGSIKSKGKVEVGEELKVAKRKIEGDGKNLETKYSSTS